MPKPNRALTEKAAFPNHSTVADLSRFLGVSVQTLKRWQKSGKLMAPAERSISGWALWSPEQAREMLNRVSRG